MQRNHLTEAANARVPRLGRPLRSTPTEGPEADQELARLAKALGHPLRVPIVRILAEKTTCICDELSVAQSIASQHLKCLSEAGLVQGSIDGPRVCDCPSQASLKRLKLLMRVL